MLRFQERLCRESSGQLAGAVFLKHNIRSVTFWRRKRVALTHLDLSACRTAEDDLTDIARFYRLRCCSWPSAAKQVARRRD